jgi:hypothetical protein
LEVTVEGGTMNRDEVGTMADAVLKAVAGATCYEGREEGAISDVRRLAREARALMVVEHARALDHFRVEAYKAEGFSDCDVCGKLAVFVWERTPAQRKKMQGPKVRGVRAQVLPVSWRCAVHVPHAFPELGEHYRDARVARVANGKVA